MKYWDQVNYIVKDKWRTTGRGWKVFLLIAIIILAILAIVGLIIWAFVKMLKGLASGVSSRGDYSLYFPKTARRR